MRHGVMAVLAIWIVFASAFVADPADALIGRDARTEAEAPAPSLWQQTMLTIRQWQMELQRRLAKTVREMKASDSMAPVAMLALLGFLYGIFHAVGPGHGKVVIASYLLANESQVRRGVQLAFLSSVAQAISAIALVGALAILLDMSRIETTNKTQWLEIVSYGLITALGGYMFVSALRGKTCGHDHSHGHSHGHGADPVRGDTSARGLWAHLLAPVLAIGIRPCSGAVIILLFTLAQGIFLAGIGATFAMAVGTAITVAALAIFTVMSRRAAVRLARSNSVWEGRINRGLALLGASAVSLFGILLLFATIGRDSPFL